jgi:hypothetical protein
MAPSPADDDPGLTEPERRVVASLHRAAAVERAPDRLRARIEATRASGATRARRRAGYGMAVPAALAALILALVLILPGGTPGAPSLSQAAALAGRGAAAPGPAVDADDPAKSRLDRKVGGVYFPNWTASWGLKATGARTDRIDGRLAVTVFYGGSIAYTIVAAPALTTPLPNRTSWHGGVAYHTLALAGQLVVTWARDGHTCVLSGAPPARLLGLAEAESGS